MTGKANVRTDARSEIVDSIISVEDNAVCDNLMDQESNKDAKNNILGSDSNHFSTHLYTRIAEASPSDVQRIAATQIELLVSYYNEILSQAKKSFNWALIAAGIGLFFLILSVGFVTARQDINISIISTLCGLIIEFISAINFYLYNRATLQMAIYQERLDRTQRFLLANSLCEGLDGEAKLKSRSNLIDVIAKTTYSSEFLTVEKKQAIKETKGQGESNATDKQNSK